jgi:hypothetical protein
LFVNRIKLYTITAIFALAVLGVRCFLLWQPQRQAILHNEHLLDAAAARDWAKVAAFMDDAYADRWEHDKASAVDDVRLALGQFFALTITGEEVDCAGSGDERVVSAKLKMSGGGTAIAQEVQRRVNELKTPFTFRWTRKSWKPWDWKLARVDNAELSIDRSAGF